MAKRQKYSIPFVSQTGVGYEARIYVEGCTDPTTTLKPGAEPFSTEEAGDGWLEPIALQTGYLRIVCDEADWRGLLPTSTTSHYVALYETGASETLVWQGYVQYTLYTHSLYCGVAEYEFPLCSALSLLEDKNLTWAPERRTFAGLIAEMLTSVGEDATWDAVLFPDNMQSDVPTDLASAISLMPFFEQAERTAQRGGFTYEETYYEAQASCKDVLEQICTFWGWTLREEGTTLYFCAHDEGTGWRRTTLEGLGTLTADTRLATEARTEVDYAGLRWMSADHTVDVAMPLKKITLEGETDGEETVMAVDLEKIAQFADLPSHVSLDNGTYHAECDGVNSYFNWLNGGVETTYQGASGDDAATRTTLIERGREYTYGPVFRKYDEWDQSANAGKTKYNWTYEIFTGRCLESSATEGSVATLSFMTLDEYTLSDCALAVSANVRSTVDMWATTSWLEMQVVVGNHHWDGTQWAEHGSDWRGAWVHVYVGNNDDRAAATKNGTIVNTLNYNTPYQGADGYGMPVGSPLYGRVAIYFRWSQETVAKITGTSGTWPVLGISNLKVKIVPSTTATSGLQPRKKNTYTASAQGTGEEKTDLTFMTKNGNLASPQLITFDGGWLGAIVWHDAEIQRPEERLLERMMRLKSNGGTEWRTIETDNRDASGAKVYNDGWTTLLPVRVQREWGDGTAHLKLGKKL